VTIFNEWKENESYPMRVLCQAIKWKPNPAWTPKGGKYWSQNLGIHSIIHDQDSIASDAHVGQLKAPHFDWEVFVLKRAPAQDYTLNFWTKRYEDQRGGKISLSYFYCLLVESSCTFFVSPRSRVHSPIRVQSTNKHNVIV